MSKIKLRLAYPSKNIIADVHSNDPVYALMEKVEKDLNIPIDNQVLIYRSGVSVTELDPKKTIDSYGIQSRDTINVQTKENKDKGQINEKLSNIKEDEIDEFLKTQDGWTKVPKTKYCNHPDYGKCNHCMPIPPWNVTQIEKFKDVKHIPFHAWLRQKQYNTHVNQVFLEDVSYRINMDEVSSKERLSVTLERQPFRHVDHILIERPSIIGDLVEKWRLDGKDRCGYLIGKYIHDPNHVPLGITAVVSALYEPPQIFDGVPKLLKDKNEEKVDEIIKKYGFQRVGYVWTSLQTDKNKKFIIDRKKVVLTSYECMKSALLQNKYPSPCKLSNTGVYGSKFVSLLIYGNEKNEIVTDAYQISNQIARLVRDKVVKKSDKDDMLRVRQSTETRLYPHIFYRAKNEYGYDVQYKADPDFPNEYAIVSLSHSTPKTPKPVSKEVASLLQELKKLK